MKRQVVDISKKMTPNETLKRLVNRVIHNNCNLMVITSALKYCADTDMWDFEVDGYDRTNWDTWHTIKGYIGCLGQMVITEMDGVHYAIEDFVEVLE